MLTISTVGGDLDGGFNSTFVDPNQLPACQDAFNQLMQQRHLSLDSNSHFGPVDRPLSNVQGYVPAYEYPHVRNGMTMPPGTT